MSTYKTIFPASGRAVPAAPAPAQHVADGLRAHRAGDRAGAERAYRAALALDPNCPDALHLLGMIVAAENPLEGMALVERAISASPRVSVYHNNLGSLVLRTGDAARAERHYRRALRLDDRNPEATLNLGKVLYDQGHYETARVTLGRAVVLAPRSVEARMALGRAEEAMEAWAAAVTCYQKATELDPTHAPAQLALGNAHKAMGALGPAEASLLRAIELDPAYADAHYNLANLRRAKGELVKAIAGYNRAIDLDPAHAEDARNNLGVTLAETGSEDEAIAILTYAVEQKPDAIDPLFNLGKEMARRAASRANRNGLEYAARQANFLVQPSDPDGSQARSEAHRYLSRVLALKPDHIGALGAMGDLQGLEERYTEAAVLYRRAIAAAPATASALLWNNLGAALINQADREAEASDYQAPVYEDAEAAIRSALKIDPDLANGWFNLAKIAAGQDEPELAFDALRRSLELAPNNAEAYQDLGVLQERQGLLEDAVASYRRARSLDPASMPIRSNLAALLALMGDAKGLPQLRILVEEQAGSPHAHYTLSVALLRAGLYEEGWAEHEWRVKTRELAGRQRAFHQPRWAGEPLEGRTILLYAEQGFGDTIQFARYAPLVASRGGRVVLEVQPALKSLLAGLEGVEHCVGRGEPLPEFALQAPLMSLPYLLRVPEPLPPVPLPVPGTFPLPESGERGAPLRVGLVWAGNSKLRRDRLRSIPLASLAPLAAVAGVEFVSLQIGAGADQIAAQGAIFGFTAADAEVAGRPREFAATAMQMGALDLIISVDTGAAHLGGSLGKPVWILLDRTADWRWGIAGDRTSWYPSARLFRQTRCSAEGPDWSSAIAQLADALAVFASGRV